MIQPYAFGVGVKITLGDTFVYKATSSGTAAAVYTLTSAGRILENAIDVGAWIDTPADAGLYEVRAINQYGDPGQPTGGTLGVWEALTSNRGWTVSTSTPESDVTATLLIEIRLASSGIVKDGATVTLNASRAGTL